MWLYGYGHPNIVINGDTFGNFADILLLLLSIQSSPLYHSFLENLTWVIILVVQIAQVFGATNDVHLRISFVPILNRKFINLNLS